MSVIEPCADESHTQPVLLVTAEQPVAERYAMWLASKYPTRIADSSHDALNVIGNETGIIVLSGDLQDISPKEFLDQVQTAGYDGKVVLVTESQSNIDGSESDFDKILRKPVSESILIATVDKFMNQLRYESCLDQYVSLAMKRARWETHEPNEDFKTSKRYADLIKDMTELEAELDEILSDFETDDFHAVLQGGLS